MKIGGLGPVEGFNRFEKIGGSERATDSNSSSGKESLSASSPGVADSKSSRTQLKSLIKPLKTSKSEKTFENELEEANASRDSIAGATTPQTPTKFESPIKTASVREGDESVAQVGRALPETKTTATSQAPADASESVETTDSSLEDKLDAIAEVIQETTETELSMRHVSMRDFLMRMKAEFGIQPDQIVKAFATLDAEALAAPPEQTAEAVLSQLNLKPEQLPKAQSFYREMLNQTGESALNETLVGVGAGISLKVLSEQDVVMDKLQKSISSLNDAFARRDDQAILASPKAPTVPTEAQPSLQPISFESTPVIESMNASSTVDLPIEASVKSNEKGTLDTDSVEGSETGDLESKLDEKSNNSKFASLGAALSAAVSSLDSSMASGSDSGSNSSKSHDSARSPKPEVSSEASIESALASVGVKGADLGGERAAVPLAAATSTSAALASALSNQNGESTNAQEIVRHAQLLVKNGGGEMKMQLKPEGIGEVQLKVAVKDGQVAIQMLTQNDSAKKVLESSLDDLKTSLAQHKLHIDAVKVEIGGEPAKQRFEQSQQDAAREQSRQMAQDFMGQFRNDREGFRQGFADLSGFRNYQQPKKAPAPEMETVVASSQSQKTSGDRRLNLVA